MVIPRVVAPERRAGCVAAGLEFPLFAYAVFLTSFDFIFQKANETKELLFERVCKETERYRGKYLAFLSTGFSSRLILLFPSASLSPSAGFFSRLADENFLFLSFRFALTVSRLIQPVGG